MTNTMYQTWLNLITWGYPYWMTHEYFCLCLQSQKQSQKQHHKRRVKCKARSPRQ